MSPEIKRGHLRLISSNASPEVSLQAGRVGLPAILEVVPVHEVPEEPIKIFNKGERLEPLDNGRRAIDELLTELYEIYPPVDRGDYRFYLLSVGVSNIMQILSKEKNRLRDYRLPYGTGEIALLVAEIMMVSLAVRAFVEEYNSDEVEQSEAIDKFINHTCPSPVFHEQHYEAAEEITVTTVSEFSNILDGVSKRFSMNGLELLAMLRTRAIQDGLFVSPVKDPNNELEVRKYDKQIEQWLQTAEKTWMWDNGIDNHQPPTRPSDFRPPSDSA